MLKKLVLTWKILRALKHPAWQAATIAAWFVVTGKSLTKLHPNYHDPLGIDDCHFILEGCQAVVCPSALLWAVWFQFADRHVAQTQVKGLKVSTVFLGINHQFQPDESPLLFETMVFSELSDVLDIQVRYSTWEEAITGHKEIVDRLTSSLPSMETTQEPVTPKLR